MRRIQPTQNNSSNGSEIQLNALKYQLKGCFSVNCRSSLTIIAIRQKTNTITATLPLGSSHRKRMYPAYRNSSSV